MDLVIVLIAGTWTNLMCTGDVVKIKADILWSDRFCELYAPNFDST